MTLLQQLQQHMADGTFNITPAQLDAIIAALQQMQGKEWISVDDRLPKRDETLSYSQVPCLVNKRYKWARGEKQGVYYQIQILVFNHENLCWDDKDGDDYNCEIDDVTHWMPLPTPPAK